MQKGEPWESSLLHGGQRTCRSLTATSSKRRKVGSPAKGSFRLVRVTLYVLLLKSVIPVERKNGWQLAGETGKVLEGNQHDCPGRNAHMAFCTRRALLCETRKEPSELGSFLCCCGDQWRGSGPPARESGCGAALEVRSHMMCPPDMLVAATVGGRRQNWATEGYNGPGCQASCKGVRRLVAVVERAGSATGTAAGGRSIGDIVDSMCQVIRAVGTRDVVANHAALAGRGGPGRGER